MPVEYLYFPVSGLISVDALTAAGESVEVGVIGREGFSGLLGCWAISRGRTPSMMQGAGAGLRIRTARAGRVPEGRRVRPLIHSFIYMQMVQMSQSVLCNRLHPVEMRMARWMLTAADRTQTDSVQITQEFLAQMLGLARIHGDRGRGAAAAGRADRVLPRAGPHGGPARGWRPGACECYHIVRETYDRLIGEISTSRWCVGLGLWLRCGGG